MCYTALLVWLYASLESVNRNMEMILLLTVGQKTTLKNPSTTKQPRVLGKINQYFVQQLRLQEH